MEALFSALPLVLVGAVGAGAYLLWSRFSRRGKLRRAPRVPIAEVKDGQVAKVVGRLRLGDGEALRAPLTGRSCAFFEVHVRQRKKSGKSSYWKTLIRESERMPQLVLEDETGRAVIESAEMHVVLEEDARFSSGFLDDASQELEAFLNARGQQSRGWIFNKTLRYSEGVLQDGELVAALGVCRLEPDPDPSSDGVGYRERPVRPRVTSGPGQELLVSDAPRLCR